MMLFPHGITAPLAQPFSTGGGAFPCAKGAGEFNEPGERRGTCAMFLPEEFLATPFWLSMQRTFFSLFPRELHLQWGNLVHFPV